MSLNVCVFMGNLGEDPKITYLDSGVVVASFSIACSRKWKDKQSGETKEDTQWARCVAFGRRAEVIAEHFKKGSQIHVTTTMRNRSWESDGKKHWITEFTVDDFQFCGNRPASGSGAAQHQAEAYGQQAPRKPPAPSGAPNMPPAPSVPPDDVPYDDDIPFS